MWKILRWILLLLLFIILLALGALWYLTGSERGTQLLLKQAQQHAPGELSWDKAEGTLSGPLDLENLSYVQEDGLSLNLGSAHFDWQPSQLLSKTVKLDSLRLAHVEVHLPPASAEPEAEKDPNAPITLPDIRLPVAIEADEIWIEDLTLYPHGAEEPIVIEEIKLSAAAGDEALQLLSLNFAMPEAQAQLSGELSMTDDYSMDLTLDWQYQHPDFGDFKGTTLAKGDLNALDTEHDIEGAAQLSGTATLTTLLEQPTWDADITLNSKNLGVFSAALDNSPLKVALKSTGNLEQFNATGKINTRLPDTDAITLDLDISGNLETLKIKQAQLNLDNYPGELTLAGDVDLAPLALDLKGQWQDLGWPITQAVRDYQLTKGNIDISGDLDNLIASLKTGIDGALTGPLNATINASIKGSDIALQQLQLQQPNGQLALDATAQFNSDTQKFETQGQWAHFQWPITASDSIIAKSTKGQFSASGAVSDYQFKLDADVVGADIPKGDWTITGRGDDSQLSAIDIQGKTLEGSLAATGTAAWAPAPRWDISLNGAGINPGSQWAELPGKLNLELNSSGSLENDQLALKATIAKLDGSFRDKPIKGSGNVTVQGDNIQIDNIALSSGNNKLTANGQLDQNWDLQWALNASDLAGLIPDIKGSINSSGTLSGPKDQPQTEFTLNIANLDANGNKIGTLKGKGTLDIAGIKASKITLEGKDLDLGGQSWDTLSLDGKGTREQHSLTTSINGELAQLALALKGGLKDDTWQGQLSKLTANKTEFGDWALEQPVTLKANAEAASVKDFCLNSKPTKLCIDGNWNATGDSRADIQLEQLKPERFAQFLPPGLQLNTSVDAKIKATLPAKGSPSADANITLAAGSIVLEGDAGPTQLDIQESTINATLKKDTLNAAALIELGELGNITANSIIRDIQGKQSLSGDIKTDIDNLTILSSFAPQVQNASGALISHLKLGGTLNKPSINGQLELQKFAAEIPQVNLKLEDTNLTVTSNGNGPLTIEGQSISGGGKLAISGDLNPTTGNFKLRIDGEDYQVANTKDLRARISPNMQIVMNSDGMSVDGTLKVPSAFIHASGSGEDSVTTLSSDVVVINEEGEEVGGIKATNMTINLRVELGDDIKVEAADFKGALAGNLTIEQTPQIAPRGYGTIEVVNGDYLIYGQQLNMQRGRIQFSGGPIDNPRLDMDVAREIPADNVIAGAKISGTAQNPIIQLYSEPTMPDASVLSYIILGQPLGTKGASYTLGKYLTPELYVSFGIDLFSAANTFNLRYKLTDKLSLQAKSGLANSADLIYTFER